MSNPYKRKALTLASSFVVASTVVSSGAIAKPVPDGGLVIKPEIINPFPVVTNPVGPEIKMPQVIIKIPRPQVVNPAPINDSRIRVIR